MLKRVWLIIKESLQNTGLLLTIVHGVSNYVKLVRVQRTTDLPIFIAFKQAYDCVNREALYYTVEEIGS